MGKREGEGEREIGVVENQRRLFKLMTDVVLPLRPGQLHRDAQTDDLDMAWHEVSVFFSSPNK